MKHLLKRVPALANSENHFGNKLHPATAITLATPILTVFFMAPPAKAWEKNVAFKNIEPSIPQLSINSPITHQIQPGDTLWELSRQYHISAEEIATYNGIAVEKTLQVGEILQIPSQEYKHQKQPQLVELPLGGRGGANPINQSLVVAPPSNGDSVTAVPHLKDFPSSSLASEKSEAPVKDFLADVKELQTQYQQKHLGEHNADPLKFSQGEEQEESMVFSPVDAIESSQESNPDSLASAPIKIEFYNRFLNPPIGEAVNPELPPLSSPEQYLPAPGQQFNGYIWPAEGIFTSGYGMRWGRMHRGIDIAGPIGTPILAAAPGEVVFAGWNSGGYGKLVKLKHPDESITFYAHNNRILVQKGQEVDQGQQIAEMGTTGRSTGPHLHFEIRPQEKGAVNPLAHLPSGNQVRSGQKITTDKQATRRPQ